MVTMDVFHTSKFQDVDIINVVCFGVVNQSLAGHEQCT